MKIIFFDGYCVLCNGFVDWLLKRDTKAIFKFASLQGETAKRLLGQDIQLHTIIYFHDNQRLEKSTAVFMILSDLGGLWKITKIFRLVPSFIRDSLYDLVAKVRYRVAGKRNSCRLPTPEEKQRILD